MSDTDPLLPAECVQDYPRPPRLEAVPQRLRVFLGGALVAETRRGLRVLETHHAPSYYFPPEDVRAGALQPVVGSSYCEWKGTARYFNVTMGLVTSDRAAWSYPSPTQGFAALRDHVAFYAHRMELCMVGDETVQPQPGGFYGGWVTANLQGTIKGNPGTRGW